MNPEHKKYILKNIGKKSVKQIAGDLQLKEKAVRRFLENEEYGARRENVKMTDTPAVISGGKVNKIPNFVFIILIIIAGLAAYSNSFTNQFVWDDKYLVENNKEIESFSNASYIFSSELFRSPLVQSKNDEPSGYYRPIQTLTYMVDYFFWKYNPAGYRLTNIFLQIASSIFIFHLCLLLLGDKWKGFIIASIFCIHPAFVPIVSYISGRADSLGLLFSLATIYIVAENILNDKKTFILWAVPCLYILAMLAKEYYLICPLFILLFIVVFKSGIKLNKKTKLALLSLGIMAGTYIVLRMTVLNFHQDMGSMGTKSFLTRAAVFPYILTGYIRTVFFPFDLYLEKNLVYSSLTEPRFILCYIIPITIIILFYYLIKTKQQANIFFLGWFVIGIVPVTNLFIPLKVFCADHWVYMASMGLIGLTVNMTDKLFARMQRMRYLKIALIIFSIIFFAVLAHNENRYWQNEDILFTHIYEKNPHTSRTQFNMAITYVNKGEYKKALEFYDRAIEMSSGEYAYMFSSRAMLYKKMGDIEKARLDGEMAVKLKPFNAEYHNNLGGFYAEMGMMDRARAEFREVLKIDPENDFAKKNLSLIGEDK